MLSSDGRGVALQQVHGAGRLVERAGASLRWRAARTRVQLEHAAAARYAEGHHEALQAGGHAESGLQHGALREAAGDADCADDGQEGGQSEEQPELQPPPPTHLGLKTQFIIFLHHGYLKIARNIVKKGAFRLIFISSG